MKKTAGFTLIELVIVIVILGILGAVAAPKFLNLQGDAYEANVKGLKSSIQSAATLANAKAILNGYDTASTAKANSATDFKQDSAAVTPNLVNFVWGFPAASVDVDGIIAMLQDSTTFSTTDATGVNYLLKAEGTNGLRIYPKQRKDAGEAVLAVNQCTVIYTQPTAKGVAPTIVANTDGC